jgi:hypothetical protein
MSGKGKENARKRNYLLFYRIRHCPASAAQNVDDDGDGLNTPLYLVEEYQVDDDDKDNDDDADDEIRIERKIDLLSHQRQLIKSTAVGNVIQQQILGAVDKSYSCAWFGHVWDYRFETYNNNGGFQDTCCYCGAFFTRAKTKIRK